MLVFACVACLLLQGAAAYAATSGPCKITITSGGKTGTWVDSGWSQGKTSCVVSSPISVYDDATKTVLLGKINSLNWSVGADPFVTLNFGVQAVGTANFFFDTGALSFPTIDPAMGFASAGATLTTDSNGGTFTGNFAGGRAYEATYNGGTVFADLISTFAAGPNTTVSETERKPGADFTTIGSVSSIRAQWDFTLSDGDGASGTSRFEVQPVPDANTLALAFAGAAPLLGGLAVRRRKTA